MPKKAQKSSRRPAAAREPRWWSIQGAGRRPMAADGDAAEVYIFGDIGDDWFDETVSARELVLELAALEADHIDVYINSYGGAVSDGIAIHNALRRHPASVTTHIEGVAVSIASLIAMAGDEIRMAENALFMVHAPWSVAIGNAADMRASAEMLDQYARAMATSYVREGIALADIEALLQDGEDHWYTAAEALEAGFVDVVVDESQSAAAALFMPAARYRIPPAAALAAGQLNEEATMPRKTQPAAGDRVGATHVTPPATPAPSAEPAGSVVPLDKEAMRTRNAAIIEAFAPFAARAGVGELERECLSDPDISIEQARARLLEHLGAGAEPATPSDYAPSVQVLADAADRRREAMASAMLARVGRATPDASNEYRGLRLLEMARASLEAAGVSTRGMDAIQVATAALRYGPVRGAQTTSDFPVLLEDVIHKMVLAGYQAQPMTWDRFCRTGDVSDFRDHKRLRTGVIGNLGEVNESGEYRNINIPDAESERIAARRRGAIVQITPEVLVNDDLGQIQNIADALGRSAGRTIESGVYTLLNSNPVMSDGVALFHADHGNLAAAGAVPGVDTLDAARVAMRKQTDITGQEYLDIMPAIALVTPDQAGNTRVVVEAVYDPDANNKLQKPNRVNGIVGDIVDSPRLAGAAWYLFADPMVAPVLEVVFLDGQREPRLEQEESFRSGGLSWRVELPFGVAAIDYRGAFKNPGA